MGRQIYFCGSIRGGRQDAELYARLIKLLKGYGTVLTEHVGDTAFTEEEMKKRTDKFIHDKDMEWLSQADYIVAEVTQVSMGVGYEIGRAVAMGKKILCLHRPQPVKSLSAMIAGAHNGSNIIVKEYSEPEADNIFKEFLQ